MDSSHLMWWKGQRSILSPWGVPETFSFYCFLRLPHCASIGCWHRMARQPWLCSSLPRLDQTIFQECFTSALESFLFQLYKALHCICLRLSLSFKEVVCSCVRLLSLCSASVIVKTTVFALRNWVDDQRKDRLYLFCFQDSLDVQAGLEHWVLLL